MAPYSIQSLRSMTPTGIEPVLPPWKGDVLTAWPRSLILLSFGTAAPLFFFCSSSPSRARTCNNSVNSRVLYHWAIEDYVFSRFFVPDSVTGSACYLAARSLPTSRAPSCRMSYLQNRILKSFSTSSANSSDCLWSFIAYLIVSFLSLTKFSFCNKTSFCYLAIRDPPTSWVLPYRNG